MDTRTTPARSQHRPVTEMNAIPSCPLPEPGNRYADIVKQGFEAHKLNAQTGESPWHGQPWLAGRAELPAAPAWPR